jgi:hypothetical protein
MMTVLSSMTETKLATRAVSAVRSAIRNIDERMDSHVTLMPDLLDDLQADLERGLAAIKELQLRDRNRRLKAMGITTTDGESNETDEGAESGQKEKRRRR